MAEGGGFENPAYDPDDPEVPGNDNDDGKNEQDPKETNPFTPGSASTPGPGGEEIPMQTMHHEKSGLPDTSYDEIPSLGSCVHQDDKPALLERAKEFIYIYIIYYNIYIYWGASYKEVCYITGFPIMEFDFFNV